MCNENNMGVALVGGGLQQKSRQKAYILSALKEYKKPTQSHKV